MNRADIAGRLRAGSRLRVVGIPGSEAPEVAPFRPFEERPEWLRVSGLGIRFRRGACVGVYVTREIVPGLEYETVAALVAGQPDPDTKFMSIQWPEFLELEIEWIADNSGSMQGEPVAKSVALMVVVTEALKQVRDSLAADGLVEENEEPLRVGVTKFSTKPERVSELKELLTAEKELKIVDRVSMTGGGTTETESLEGVYKGMQLRAGNVLKIVIMLSDGQGDREGVWPIVRQIEDDDEVIFLAVSLANSDEGQAIIDTYARPLIKDPENTNVAVMHCRNLEELLEVKLML